MLVEFRGLRRYGRDRSAGYAIRLGRVLKITRRVRSKGHSVTVVKQIVQHHYGNTLPRSDILKGVTPAKPYQWPQLIRPKCWPRI
jgi:hypothetical protein